MKDHNEDMELDLFHEQDLNIEVTESQLDVVQSIEDQVRDAIINQNLDKAISIIQNVTAAVKLVGIALARVVWLLNENWITLASANDVEEDFATYINARTGLSRISIIRYTKISAMLHELPKEISEPLERRNIKDLVPISTAYMDGIEFEKSDWERIINAPDFGGVAEVVREMRGTPPRRNSLMLSMDEQGSLWVKLGADGERRFFGSLEVNDLDRSVQQAIARIVNSSGIFYR